MIDKAKDVLTCTGDEGIRHCWRKHPPAVAFLKIRNASTNLGIRIVAFVL